MTRNRTVGVAMIGYQFMGAVHSQAWRTVHRAFDLPVRPRMVALVGRNSDATEMAAERLGWGSFDTDWRVLLDREDVDLVDICTPGDSHAEIATAALQAGKHVLCEKPLGNTVAEAEAMTDAAQEAAGRGVWAMVGFNYRRVPAITLAREMIAAGRLGTIRHVRTVYLQDWIVDPDFPLVWRLQKEKAGSGALGDLGAHIVDLAQYLLGQRITSVTALTETFVRRRPLPGSSAGLAASGGSGFGEVTVDDAALFLARFSEGAVGTFEATRFAAGRKNGLRIEINGSEGSLAFDVESLNELSFYDHAGLAANSGFRRILVTEPEHPYLDGWWPPGHLLGWEHSFTHEVRDLLLHIAAGTQPEPSFADGLAVQRVLQAVEDSAVKGTWQHVF